MTVVEIVERERTRLRAVDATSAVALALVVTVLVVGAGAWMLAEARWIALPRATPLLVWAALVLANAVVWWIAGRMLRKASARSSVAAAIEREQTLRAGALRGVLEVANRNALARRADRALADRLSGRGTSLAPQLYTSSRNRAARTTGIAAVTIGLLLWAAPALNDGLLAIRRPIAAWRGTLVPALQFRNLPSELLRGESVRIIVEARGRRNIQLGTRTTGEGWRDVTLAVDSVRGTATLLVGPVRGDLRLVASDGRSATDTMTVRVSDRPFVGGVVLRAIYPSYLGRPPEGLPVGEPARVPQGTTIEVAGRASTALTSVFVRGTSDSVSFRTNGHAFEGRFTPVRSARLDWFAFGMKGPIADVPLPLEIEIIPDSVPRVDLVSPATDTLVASSDRVPLQVTATDDHGLVSVELATQRRVPGSGKEQPIVQRLSSDEVTVWNGTPTVDLSTRELKPGDALSVQVAAVDNSPWAQRGVSRELVIRVPTMEERRSLARNAADSAAAQATRAAQAQRSLEQRTDEASRERSRNTSQNTSGARGAEGARLRDQQQREMSYESAEKARALAQEQRELTDRVNKLKEAAKQLEEQLRQASALDTGLARQLREAQNLLKDALTPQLLEQMKKLENATRELSGDQAREALKDLAEMQKRLREQLEKSAEMLKRAALEGAMETLKDEAKEIAEKQRALADSSRGMDRANKQERGEQLADRSERLSKDVKQLQERLSKEKADAAAQKAASAQQHAQNSERQMRSQDAKSAAQQMEQAAKDMQDARDQQVGEWKKELTEALDQSIQELLQMAREESSLEEQARAAGRDQQKIEQLRGQQSAVHQGVDQTSERLQKEGQKSSLLSGKSQRAMSEAKQKVGQATQQLSEPRGGQRTGNSLGEAAEALNRAAASLARDRERANSASSATGFAEMLQQMQEMAKKQGSINAQAQGLMPIPGQGMSQDAQATARMLARQQRSIAEQLDELSESAGGDRAGELAKEARQLAEALEQTKVDANTVARQQQLFRRLLDAGRSLEKEEREDNEKREAKAATGDLKFDPGQAPAAGRAAVRFREPEWNELRGLSADERRAILEYFKRINAEKP
ncbi:MAG TPA: hypothetical protein VFT29_00225 [Gemmatimonadaceae bacterium]|nr:hypothetical protein [Gemmatimonadaceae bacterium]